MRAPKLSSNVQRNAPETLIQPASQRANVGDTGRSSKSYREKSPFVPSALKACSE